MYYEFNKHLPELLLASGQALFD